MVVDIGKTSNEVKWRWKKENYKNFSVDIYKPDGEEFAELCKKNGDTKAGVLRQAVYDYIGKPVPPSKAKW